MIEGGIRAFAGRRILLLQGPVGPFFARLERDLRNAGAEVWKINFHGGDCLFHPRGTAYRGTMEDWPRWIEARLRALDIDCVFLFGDCRPVHKAAHAVATRLGIEVGVFEEGYIRPDFVTLERHGVNGNSLLPRSPAEYLAAPDRTLHNKPMPRAFWSMVWWGFLYFLVGALSRPLFPHYRHHRPLALSEGLPWLRSPLRKAWYRWRQRGIEAFLTGPASRRYFLVPLQVHNDAQVLDHADIGGVEGFIAVVVASFARHAPAEALLVLKHHPMDRGYRDYTALIRRLAARSGCDDRVIYIHDQHTPTLTEHARGVVVINSTAGLAAVGQGRPTKTVGAAMYDMPGLTFQDPLDRFWTEAERSGPDPHLYRKFRDELVAVTQINGNFYRRLDPLGSATGLLWTDLDDVGRAPPAETQPVAPPVRLPAPIRVPAPANAEAPLPLPDPVPVTVAISGPAPRPALRPTGSSSARPPAARPAQART